MTEISAEQNSIIIDADTIDRLTTGTAFQRSMNAVANMDAILCESQADMLKLIGIPKQLQKAMLRKMKKDRERAIRENMPDIEGFDRSVIDVFYR